MEISEARERRLYLAGSYILGIDPGVTGGIAVVGPGHALAWKMPETEREIWECIRDAQSDHEVGFTYLEKVHSMPKQGVKSMFTFGQNYGFLRACLIASEFPFEEVRPTAWQKHLGLIIPKGKDVPKTKKKAILRAKAQQLFPKLRVTNHTADALLIAEFGQRLRAGAYAPVGLCQPKTILPRRPPQRRRR